MRELMGKKIFSILISDDKTKIRFIDYSGNTYDYVAEGECCSHSWIEHIAGINAMLGQTVLEVEEVDLSVANIQNAEEDEFIDVYGWKFKCTGGVMDLEFRNSSNGYYGGWMEYVKRGFGDAEGGLRITSEDF